MNVIYSVKDYVTNVLEFHQGTVSGAIDIVAVQHEDGAIRCSPFHVHFGKTNLKRVTDKVVQVVVNGTVVDGVHMKLGAAGEAFFVDQVDAPVEDADYNTSPIASPALPMYASDATGAYFDRETLDVQLPSPSGARDTPAAPTSVGDPPEWHDAYRRLAPDGPPTRRDDLSSVSSSPSPSDRLTWGWGALPIVQSAALSDAPTTTTATTNSVETDTDDELPMMVKSDSVYFDAIETETNGPTPRVGDHPCMSLCGHLLGDAESQADAHAIFSDHIITFEYFRDHALALLRDPNLMFLLHGRICPFSPEVQAHFVARVLFPHSAPLPVSGSASSPSPPLLEHADGEHAWPSDDAMYRDLDAGDDRLTDEMDLHRHGRQVYASGGQIDTAFVRESPRLEPLAIPESGDSSAPAEAFYRKTLEPSHADLLKMELHYGTNDIEFVVRTASGVQDLRVSARLFYWPISAKIVIVEIDGAVSRVAAPGMFSGLLSSKDAKHRAALHPGALEFYAKLARNGYRVVYLTGRGLSQAELIHSLLRPSSATGVALPNGPVLFAPDRLLATSSDDVIDAQDFKVAALNGIRALFPSDVNPFYAAFGRTVADSVVLTQVGVFPGKVFLVDEGDGRLRHKSMMNFQESYSSLVAMLDKMFPPLCALSPRAALSSSYSSSTPGRSSRVSLSDSPLLSSSSSSVRRSVTESSSNDDAFASGEDSDQDERIPPAPLSLKRNFSVTDDLVSEVVTSQARTRSMGDEAYNDLNFWRIRPGRV